MLRRLAVVVATGLAAAGFGLAHAGNAGAATYTVCGFGSVVPILGGGSCMTLDDAIAAAQLTPEADTIRMLPGSYCPIDLEGTFAQPVRFVGVGFAGVDLSGGPVSFSGPEASLTTITNDSVHCDSSVYAIQVNARVTSSAPMVFENLTADGAAGGEYGFRQAGVATNTILRDDVFQHFSGQFGWGVYFTSGFNGNTTSLDLENSAVLNNTFGVDLEGADASVYDTTIAGNTNTGLILVNYEVSLGSDTISHNRVGVTAPSFGSGMQIVDSVVAGNTLEDCNQVPDWESGGGFEPGSFGNLVGDFSCPINQGSAHGDVRDATLTPNGMQAVGPNGGPTPSIMPPSSDLGMDTPSCGLGGVDQREYVNPSASTCDPGAVQLGGSGAHTVAAGDLDLGTIAVGSTQSGTVSLGMTGGDIVGVSGVSISGAGWAIADDECTFSILETSSFSPLRGCIVGVTVHPTGAGAWNGTLTIHTTAGDAVAQLHAHVSTPPSISSFTPSSGPVGTPVTINGSHLTGVSAVSFNGTAAASFTVVSDTEIDAVVAPGTATGAITVTGPSGSRTTLHVFVVTVPHPVIQSFGPGQGAVGSTVTILGLHLSNVTAVTFGGVPAVTFSSSDGSVTATVPAGAASGHIAVTTAGGTATTIRVYVVIPAPTITSFTPTSGVQGTHVMIHGSGFTGATSVKFHGKAATFTVVSDSVINAVVPAAATTGHIAVTTPGGAATSAATFTI
ncbi:MAG TPA: IPT/TIG domain-containing protein [Gaiellaceae bacterium]